MIAKGISETVSLPVSYMMPFPHQAIVFVAPAGLWESTQRAGGDSAAFPTP